MLYGIGGKSGVTRCLYVPDTVLTQVHVFYNILHAELLSLFKKDSCECFCCKQIKSKQSNMDMLLSPRVFHSEEVMESWITDKFITKRLQIQRNYIKMLTNNVWTKENKATKSAAWPNFLSTLFWHVLQVNISTHRTCDLCLQFSQQFSSDSHLWNTTLPLFSIT